MLPVGVWLLCKWCLQEDKSILVLLLQDTFKKKSSNQTKFEIVTFIMCFPFLLSSLSKAKTSQMSSPLPPLHHLSLPLLPTHPPPILLLTSPIPPFCLTLNPLSTLSPLATCAWRLLPLIIMRTSCRSRCSGSCLIMVSWFWNTEQTNKKTTQRMK